MPGRASPCETLSLRRRTRTTHLSALIHRFTKNTTWGTIVKDCEYIHKAPDSLATWGAMSTWSGAVGPVSSSVDTQLLSELRSDNGAAALERAYRRHAGSLVSLVTHCIGASSLAGQVVEDVFVRLWEEPESFLGSRRSLRSCLAEDAYRRCEALSAQASGTADGKGNGVPGPWQQLSPLERVTMGLVRFGEMTSDQVAVLLDVSPDTVNSTILEGLQRLARGQPG